MGCIGSKPDTIKSKKGKNVSLKGKGRSNSNSSFESFEQKKAGRSNSVGSQSCSESNDGELSDDEIDQIEKEQRELIWAQKALLRNRVRKEGMMDEVGANDDLLKQEEEMATLNYNALKKQKQSRRRKLKRKAEKEQKWMVFSNLDCFDEADMTNLADFLATIMKVVPTSEEKNLLLNNKINNNSSSINNTSSNSDNNSNSDNDGNSCVNNNSSSNGGESHHRMDTNGGKDFRYNFGVANVIASYLTKKDELNCVTVEDTVLPVENKNMPKNFSKNAPAGNVPKNVPEYVPTNPGNVPHSGPFGFGGVGGAEKDVLHVNMNDAENVPVESPVSSPTSGAKVVFDEKKDGLTGDTSGEEVEEVTVLKRSSNIRRNKDVENAILNGQNMGSQDMSSYDSADSITIITNNNYNSNDKNKNDAKNFKVDTIPTGGSGIQIRKNLSSSVINKSVSTVELVQAVRSASLTNSEYRKLNSAAVKDERRKKDENVIEVFRSFSMDAIMICDTDELVSVARDTSKTRLMGVNIHPSRKTEKTEIEKKEENEELLMIISTLEDSSDDRDVCTNNEIKSHELLTKGSMDACVTDNNPDQPHNHSHNNTNNTNSTDNDLNDIKIIDTSQKNESNTSNNGNDSESVKTTQTTQSECKKASNKSDNFTGNSSNLNLIEGDLPEEMLLDFDMPSGPITPDVAGVILNVLKQGGRLSFKSVHKILRISYKFLSELPNTTKCEVGPNDRLTTVGDIHGQLPDLIHILEDSGFPSATNKYIFNGDFVDRGPRGVEVMCLLLVLFSAFPRGTVVLNRGNHEDYAICCAYGFQVECLEKYDDITFGMFVEVFSYLPLFAIINDSILVVHGGIFHTQDALLTEMNAINRAEFSLRDMPEGGEKLDQIPRFRREDYLKQLARDALWSDPMDALGIEVNVRGAGVAFGPDRVRTFLDVNNLKMIVRSHECVRTGFDQPFSGVNSELLCTIFSASNYGGGGNSGAYLVFTRDPKLNKSVGPKVTGENGEQIYLCQRSGTPLTRVTDTDIFYSTFFFDIAFSEDEINEDVNYDSDYEESLALSAAYLEKRDENGDLAVKGASTMLKVFDGDTDNEEKSEITINMNRNNSNNSNNSNSSNDSGNSGSSGSSGDGDNSGHISITVTSSTSEVANNVGKNDEGTSNNSNNSNTSNISSNGGNSSGNNKNDGTTSNRSNNSNTSNNSNNSNNSNTSNNSNNNINSYSSDNVNNDASSTNNNVDENESVIIGSAVVDSLYAHHKRLAELFQYFDADNSGIICKDEFRRGCEQINRMLPPDEQMKNCDKILDIMDVNGSGTVDVNSFFELFRLADMHTNYNLSASLSASMLSPPVSASVNGSMGAISPSAASSTPGGMPRKYSLSPLLSPVITPISTPSAFTLEKQDSLSLGMSEPHRLTEKTRSRSMSSMPSPKLSSKNSPIVPIITVDKPLIRRLRSLSTQQQTVISAQGEAVFVLSRNSLDTSNHGNSRKNSLDNSNHGYSSQKNSLDYSFHGNDFLPDDLPEDGDELSKKNTVENSVSRFFSEK